MENSNLKDSKDSVLDAGSLLLYREFQDFDLLFKVLAAKYPYSRISHLRSVLSHEDFIKFFDVFQGVSIRIPKRSKIKRNIINIIIYNYCKREDFSEGIIKDASVKFKKHISTIKNIIKSVGAFDSDK